MNNLGERKNKRQCTEKFTSGYFKVKKDDQNVSSEWEESDDSRQSYDSDFKEGSPRKDRSSGAKGSKSKKLEKAPLSEFELKVQKNVAEKMALLEKLGVTTLKNEFVKPKKKKEKKVLDVSEEDCRRSKRINPHGNFPEFLPFKEAITDDCDYEDYTNGFGLDNIDLVSSPPKVDSTGELQKMVIKRKTQMTDDMIYALDVHPNVDDIIVSVGSKEGEVGFWNVYSDSPSSTFKIHGKAVTHVMFHPEKPYCLVSSSSDGSMRCGDLYKETFSEVYSGGNNIGCTYFDVLSESTYLVAQTNGNISILDYRASRTFQKTIKFEYESGANTVSVHPLKKSYFVSCYENGYLCLWDLRNIQSLPLYQIYKDDNSIPAAFFSPYTGKHILASFAEDTLCLFDSSKLTKEIKLKRRKFRSHFNPWKLVASWMPGSDSTFVAARTVKPKCVEVHNDNINVIHQFEDKRMSDSHLNVFHPCRPVMASADPSGKVYVLSA